LLAHDVALTGDGGGKAPALARSLRGRNRVAPAVLSWMRLAARVPGVSLRPVEVNGGSGALFLDGQQRVIGVLALEMASGQIPLKVPNRCFSRALPYREALPSLKNRGGRTPCGAPGLGLSSPASM
jgi:hypothetical protein